MLRTGEFAEKRTKRNVLISAFSCTGYFSAGRREDVPWQMHFKRYGNELKTNWFVYNEACEYFGDYLVVICEVQDQSDAPMTLYAEYVIEIQ